MRRKNTKVAEIILIIALIVFGILVAVTYKNLSIISNGLSDNNIPVEVTTEYTTDVQ